MKRANLQLAAALLLTPSMVVAQPVEPGNEKPLSGAIYSSKSGYPVWVPADAVVNDAGEFDFAMLESLPTGEAEIARHISRQAKATNAPCVEFGPVYKEPPPGLRPSRNLDELVTNAQAVLQGTVVDIEGGFFAGNPGLLLQVRVDERLKPSERFWTGPYVYVHYPVGEISFGSIRICKTDDRWPPPPTVGNRVLLFPFRVPFDDDGLLMGTITASPFEIVIESDGQLLGGPSWLGDDERVSAGTLDGLARDARTRLASEQKEGER